MEKFLKLFTALVLIWINGIEAQPLEAGENETASPNVTTTDAECPGVPKSYYEELNCKPVFKNPQDHCPTRYTCDNFEEFDAEMCYFRGEFLAPGTPLNNTGNPCDINCSCELQGPFEKHNVSKMAVFRCAIVDCPLEELSSFDENGEMRDCVPKKSHDECCASEVICLDSVNHDKDDDNSDNTEKKEIEDAKRIDDKIPEEQAPKKLATCVTTANKTYVEGQEFYLDELPCKVCICQPGYTAGESGEPWCRDVQCGTVIRHTRRIRGGCAPLYYGTNGCCPIDFHCPNTTDSVISDVVTKIALNPEESCKFGDLSFRVGDRLATRPDDRCVECECQVPPILTCRAKPDCE